MLTSTITNEAPRVNTNNVSYPAGTFEFPSGVADIVAIPFTNSTESISAVNVPASAIHSITDTFAPGTSNEAQIPLSFIMFNTSTPVVCPGTTTPKSNVIGL